MGSRPFPLNMAAILLEGLELINRTVGGLMNKAAAAPGAIYNFTVKTIDGQDKPLADYKGQALLIVNTASLCGLTPQYDGLERLNKRFKDKGLRILGFPANDFGKQEPGADSQIKEFCRTRFSISFDLFSKITVKGPDQHPLYSFLTRESGHPGEISWNFAKFLVDKEGNVAARFSPPTDPEAPEVVAKVEELLG